MQIQNAIITGSFSYNGADLSNVTSSNAYSASLSSRTTNLESTSSVLVGASASFSSILSSVSSSQQQLSSSFLTLTASFNAVSASQQQISASYIALSASYNTFSGSASTRITVDSASLLQVSSSQQQISASLLNVISIFATTGSNSFRANQSITGSLTVTGQIIAQTLNVQQVTSSIIYSSGSNNFGCDLNSRQTFTGSVLITGSLTIAGASSATSYSGTTIYGSTIACSPIGCFATSCATAFIGGTLSGTTIYGSTAVCSAVGKFTSCIDAGTGTFSGNLLNTNSNFQTYGSASFGVSTWGLSIGNGNASANYYRANDHYFQNGAGTQTLQIASTGAATFACQVNAESFYTNDTRYISNQIMSGYNANSEDSDIWINYTGYLGGTTRFRDFRIGNGKQGQIALFDGSTGAASFACSVTGTTIYGSTAVCSPVGKFTTCLDLGGALTGTSATFSGLVTINTNTRGLALNRDAVTNYNGIGYQTAGVQKWFVGMRENLSSNNYIIYSEVGTDILTLNQSTGAATFSFIGSGYGITSKATSNYNGILTDTSTNTGGGYFAAAKNGTRYSVFGTTGAWVGDTSTDTAIVSEAASSNIRFYTNGSATESMRISCNGNVGIGTATPGYRLETQKTTAQAPGIFINQCSSDEATIRFKSTHSCMSDFRIGASILVGSAFEIYNVQCNKTNYMVNCNGFSKISNDGTFVNGNNTSYHSINSSGDLTLYLYNTNATGNGILSNVQSCNTSYYSFRGFSDPYGDMAFIYSNGTFGSRTGTYGGIVSDARCKTEICDASSQWSDIKNLRVRNFKLIEDVENDPINAMRQIGFIAQEVETVSPGLVFESGNGCVDSGCWKNVKTSIIHTKAVKALQEAMCRIEILESCLGIN